MTQNNSQQDYNSNQPLGDSNPNQTQNQVDVQQKLKELEAQVYQTTKETTPSDTETQFSFTEQINGAIKTLRNWFDNLPQVGKLIVGIGAIMMGFSVLNLFLHLITNLISVAILGLILYGLYKYLFSNSQTQ